MRSNLKRRLDRLARQLARRGLPPLILCGDLDDDQLVVVSDGWTHDGEHKSWKTSTGIQPNRKLPRWDLPPYIVYGHREGGQVGLVSVSWSENGKSKSWHATAGIELPRELVALIAKYPCNHDREAQTSE